MIRVAMLACALALPATAQDMTHELCRDAWRAFGNLTDQPSRLMNVKPGVTDAGWCRVDDTNADLRDNDFEALEFRAGGLEAALAGGGAPQSLDMRSWGIDMIAGLEMDLPPEFRGPRALARFTYRSDPATRDIELEALEFQFGGLGHLKVSGSGGGIDLSSLSAMQFTIGGARAHVLNVQLQTTPVLTTALFADVPRDMVPLVISALPDHAIDAASRADLLAFWEAGPEATGLLRIEARSENGLGFIQMGGGMMAISEQGPTPEALAKGLDIMLSGAEISAQWITVD